MGWIDVAIPGVIGLWLILRPRSFANPNGDPDKEASRQGKVRGIGVLLLAVAGVYLLGKLASTP